MKENQSRCVECDKKLNDDTDTKWNKDGEPICREHKTRSMTVGEWKKKHNADAQCDVCGKGLHKNDDNDWVCDDDDIHNKEENRGGNQKLIVGFSEEDLQRLTDGESFDWTFPTEKSGEQIDIKLINEDYYP